MNDKIPGLDWDRARGEQWRAQLSGMEAMLAPMDEPLIHSLELAGACNIADLGCGGGGTSLRLLERAPSGSVIRGFDISSALVETARRRSPESSALSFEVADLAIAKPPTPPFDRIVSRFGMMFFEHPLAAFSNLLHWLAPGGRFSFAVWGALAENPWFNLARATVAEVVDAPLPGPDAPGAFRYAQTEGLLQLLAQAGFEQLAVRDWRGSLSPGGDIPAAAAARFALVSFANFNELLTAAGASVFEQAQRTLTTRFSAHEQDGAVRLSACVHLVTGFRPR